MMPADMENHSTASGRKRGATKHSIEDQALDQIAKEKIVGFGSGRASNEASADEDSRPVTPEEVKEDVKPTKKKKRKGSKKHKEGKEELISENIETDFEKDPETTRHVIPDIFFEDLSETDKSNTSKEVSSSDISDNISTEKSVDVWADRDDDFVARKKTDKDQVDGTNDGGVIVEENDFWGEIERKEEVSTQKTDNRDSSEPDFWGAVDGDENISAEKSDIDNSLNGESAGKDSSEPNFWGAVDEEENISVEKTYLDNSSYPESPEKDASEPNFCEAVDGEENISVEKTNLDNSSYPESPKKKLDTSEPDIWGEVDGKENISVEKTYLDNSSYPENSEKDTSETDFWSAVDGEENISEEKTHVDNSSYSESTEKGTPEPDFWGAVEGVKQTNTPNSLEIVEEDGSAVDKKVDEETGDFWSNYDEDAVFSARKASLDEINVRRGSKTSSSSPEKSLKGSRKNSKSSSKNSKSVSPEKFSKKSMKTSASPEKSRKSAEKSESPSSRSQSVDSISDRNQEKVNSELESKFETDSVADDVTNRGEGSIWDDDYLPPIYEIKKSLSPSADVVDDQNSAHEREQRSKSSSKGRGSKRSSKSKSSSVVRDFIEKSECETSEDATSEKREKRSKSKSVLREEQTSKNKAAEPEIEQEGKVETREESPKRESESESEDSPETMTESSSGSESSEEPKKTDNSGEDRTERDESQENSDEEDLLDKTDEPKRNFTKAIRDFEGHSRRRSVVIPEARERTESEYIPTPPPLPSSPPPFPRSPPQLSRGRPSESSLEGQVSRSGRPSESSLEGRGGRTRHISETSTEGEGHDDGIMDYLGKENDRAEARLAARRQARVEAREIRMKELERVQKEQDENSDKVVEAYCTTPPHLNNNRQPSMSPRDRPTPNNSYHSSRRSSEDSMDDTLGLRDIRHELKEVEEKFRKAMIANAQLDNEKAAHAYQVELLKDRLEDLEEAHALLNREHKERCREHENLKRVALKLREDLTMCGMCLEERDRLIADYGLIIVGGEVDETGEATPRALVSSESAQVLEAAGEGSLDVRLKALANEKNDLADEVRHLKLELEEERNKRRFEQNISNGPLTEDVQQTLNDYKFKLQKAEQDSSTLQATVTRLEGQVMRYKTASEEAEKAEEELKQEKRKLLREHRDSIARIEELETSNSHLQRRMDKLKNAKSTLLKEL